MSDKEKIELSYAKENLELAVTYTLEELDWDNNGVNREDVKKMFKKILLGE